MLFRRLLRALVVLTCLVACASQDEPPEPDPYEPDPIVMEVQQRCSDYAARLCASAASCCESTGDTFSPDDCAASFIDEFCGSAAQVVGAGLATYHPEDEAPCLAAWDRAHATCVADWEQIITIRRDVWAACKMVRGTIELGRGCSTSSSCAQPEGPATARCLPHPMTGDPTCQLLEILGEGAECPFHDGEVPVCDVGLYCTTTELDMLGTCEPAVPEGGACDPEVPANPECGLGSYCGLDDGLCHRAQNFGGPECAQGPECVSFRCMRSSSGGSCTEALSTAADLCERGAE